MKQRRAAPELPLEVPPEAPPSDVQEPKDDTRPGFGPTRRQKNVTPDFIAANFGAENDDPRPGPGSRLRSNQSVPELAPSPPSPDSDEARPGLGPMMRPKKSITQLSSPSSPDESKDSRPGLGPMASYKKSVTDMSSPSSPEESKPGLGSMMMNKKSTTDMSSPSSPEDSKPGLGPMIRGKKGNAGSMWKAAAAAAAFQPRRGGAGERLRMAKDKSEDGGPDGITDVVPAPPRPPTPEAKTETPEPVEDTIDAVPEVLVTVPQASRPSSSHLTDKKPPPDKKMPPVPSPSQDDQRQEEERRAVNDGNDIKYLATLGIDPAQAPMFLNNQRSVQLREWMDVAGFVPGEKMRSCTWDHMKSDLDREVDKAQAGGWLSRFRDDDERIDAIKGGIDHVILECEQLDDLLTLYSAGLGVSVHVPLHHNPKILTALD